jgi:hypothetical protein
VLWVPSLSGLLFCSLRRLFSSHRDVSILQFTSRQTKHWNDHSGNTTSTIAVQEDLNSQTSKQVTNTTTTLILKMELSPAFSITSDMTDEELDLYFASCGSLSNLPTPPPAKEHTTIEKPALATSDLHDFAPELQGKFPTIQHRTITRATFPVRRQVCCWSWTSGTCSAERRSPAC